MTEAVDQTRLVQPDEVPDRFINAEQLASFMRVTKATVYRMTKRGDLPPSTRFGKGHQWLESSLQQHFGTNKRIAGNHH